MMGILTDKQIDYLLGEQFVGRIGCFDKGSPYVVPVSYVHAGQYIYCQSREGLKINLLRANPLVSFQVDSVTDLANWRSIVLAGRYEEMKGGKKEKEAMMIIKERFGPVRTGEQTTYRPMTNRPPEVVEKQPKPVYFRIRITSRSGRYEKD